MPLPLILLRKGNAIGCVVVVVVVVVAIAFVMVRCAVSHNCQKGLIDHLLRVAAIAKQDGHQVRKCSIQIGCASMNEVVEHSGDQLAAFDVATGAHAHFAVVKVDLQVSQIQCVVESHE